MPLTETGYRPRLIDEQIARYLKTFGAVSIEGPKSSGKTWTSLNHAESVFFVGDPANGFSNRSLAQLDPGAALDGEAPHAIDEWQEVPGLWDAVRFSVDRKRTKGRYILTGSANPVDNDIMHSGAGRIARVSMRPMSLFESGDSQKTLSLSAVLKGDDVPAVSSGYSIDDIIGLVIRGGWPDNTGIPPENAGLLPKSYIEALIRKDMSLIDGVARLQTKVRALLRSLARNNVSLVSNKTLAADIALYRTPDEGDLSERSIADYLNALRRLFVIEEIPAWSPEIRAKIRLRVSPKRMFADPSLAVAALNADEGILKSDMKTLGFLFEGLCLRDLQVYAQSYGAAMYHYLDNSNLEIDAIMEMKGGEWAAFEIKLGGAQIEEAACNLIRLKEKITGVGNKPPSCLAVITGVGVAGHRRKDGVAVLPISCLSP